MGPGSAPAKNNWKKLSAEPGKTVLLADFNVSSYTYLLPKLDSTSHNTIAEPTIRAGEWDDNHGGWT